MLLAPPACSRLYVMAAELPDESSDGAGPRASAAGGPQDTEAVQSCQPELGHRLQGLQEAQKSKKCITDRGCPQMAC